MNRSYDRDRDDRSRYRSGDWDRGEEYQRREWEDRSRGEMRRGDRSDGRGDNWAERTGDRLENWADRAGDRLENWTDRAGSQVRSWFDDDDRRRGEDRGRGGYDRDRRYESYNYGSEGMRDDRSGGMRRDYDMGRRHLEDAGYSDRWHSRGRDDDDWSRSQPRSRMYGPTSQSSLYDNGPSQGSGYRSGYGSDERSGYGQGGGYNAGSGGGSNYGSGLMGGHDYRTDRDRERRDWGDRRHDENPRERGMLERAGDQVRSWFGDDDAERRRRNDERYDRSHERRGGWDERDRGW